MSHLRPTRVLLAALVALPILAFAPAAHAAPTGRHCVVEVVGKKASGEFVTTPERCYSTYAAAMRASGFDTSGLRSVTPQSMAEAGRLQSASSFTIGTHFDSFGYTGPSFSVTGSDCLGGWLNLTASWVNKVSSTINGCARILHFDGFNRTGWVEATFSPGGNLGGNNNKTNSIQYTT